MSPPPAGDAPSGTRWSRVRSGPRAARRYRQHFLDLAAQGHDLHGEARFVSALAPPPARVLDAGCGFGRVAGELTRLGHTVVGVDADPHLVALAQEDPTTTYLVADLATVDLDLPRFDVVVMAGNVVPYLADGTLPAVLARLSAHLAPGGRLVAGFSLGDGVPEGAAPVALPDYDTAAAAAGLVLEGRHGGWDGEEFAPAGGYAVSVHRRSG